MKSQMPATQVSRGTHYHSVESLTRKDGIIEGGYEEAIAFTAAEMKARPAKLVSAAQMKAANPKAWKGWKTQDIARTIPTYVRDEDGEIWAA